MSDIHIINKLRKSHIPPYAFRTNFATEQMEHLRARIEAAAVRNAEVPINFYLHAADSSALHMRKAVVAVGLMAKAMCLQDKKVVHTTLAGFLREQRFAEMEREANSVNPVMSQIGSGYIAICDFLEYADVEQKYGYHSLQLAADYLIEHIERGGGLILGASNIPPREAIQYGAAFNALLDMFEAYRI